MTTIIIQARMGSTRLPGKVMKSIKNRPLIFYLINQIKECQNEQIVVATSLSPNDDVIENFVKTMNVETFRGSENDVLDRFYQCAKNFSSDPIVRISADSPLIDPKIIQDCITTFEQNDFDYLSNTIKQRNDIWVEDFNGFPKGFAVEIFKFNALEKAWKQSISDNDREHVTEYFWKNPQLFKLGSYKNKHDYSNYRLVVDYPDDFKLIKKIIENFPNNTIFSFDEIISFLENNPSLAKINSDLS